MKKLTIEILQNYLAYGLKAITIDGDNKGEIYNCYLEIILTKINKAYENIRTIKKLQI